MSKIIIQPQPGRQTEFLATPADICFYGGAAGSGKSHGLLQDALRLAVSRKGINCALFRRERTDLTKPGGLWDESKKMYPLAGGRGNETTLNWKFPHNSRIQLDGLQYERDKYSHQGSQLDWLGMDELPHFLASQWWYLVARLRSVTGSVKPYARATCNPEPGWVYELVKWWIKEDGFPDFSRATILRWFFQLDDQIYWFDTKERAIERLRSLQLDKKISPLSFTFIPATINDNPILLRNNPNYYANLAQLPTEEKRKLLYGNWLFTPIGKLFNIQDFQHFSSAIPLVEPDICMIIVDTASEIKTANDYTVAQIWMRKDNKIYLIDQVRGKFDWNTQMNILTSIYGKYNPRWMTIEKAATGISLLQELKRTIGANVLPVTRKPGQDKYRRGYESEPYIQSGYVYIDPHADYYTDFITEVSNFSPENKNKNHIHDDQVDCLMDAIYYLLITKIKGLEKVTPPVSADNAFGYARMQYAPKTFQSVSGRHR